MRLDDFIQDALIQIATGVAEANKSLTDSDNPNGNLPFLMQRGNDGGQTTGIAFDIAVTTKHGMQASANGKGSIFIANAEFDANGSYDREQVSRIKFTIGVDSRLGYALINLKKTDSNT